MEQLIVRVANKEKAEMLSQILTALDFVNSVEIIEENPSLADDEQEFFAMAGLWENRTITIDSIRQEAWREEVK
jgi:hypothetical protein